MILTIKNQTASPLSYVQGQITVAANGNTIVPRDYNVLVTSDAAFLNDATSGNIIVNNGATDLSGPSILLLAQSLAPFSTTPIAVLPLYYSLNVNIRQSAATAANTTVWAMRNDAASVKQIMIEQILLNMSFDAGTPLGRSLQRYEIRRFNTATPTGGTSITVIPMDSLSPATTVTDARQVDTGLTVTSIVFENIMDIISCPATDQTVVPIRRDFVPIKLAAGEGLAIRLNVASVVGQGLCGRITWSER